jgi:hypothetical protein
MTEIGIVGGVTEYRASSLVRVQLGAVATTGITSRPAHTGTGGRT